MSHIISLKVTKFQQPLLITLGVADEKPEGCQKAPPPRDIGLSLISTHAFRLSPAKFFAWDMRRVVKRIEQDEKIFQLLRNFLTAKSDFFPESRGHFTRIKNFHKIVIRAMGENIGLIHSFIRSFTHREKIHLIISMDHPVFDWYCASIYISKN